MVGFNNKEIKDIEEVVEKNSETFKLKWNEYFS